MNSVIFMEHIWKSSKIALSLSMMKWALVGLNMHLHFKFDTREKNPLQHTFCQSTIFERGTLFIIYTAPSVPERGVMRARASRSELRRARASWSEPRRARKSQSEPRRARASRSESCYWQKVSWRHEVYVVRMILWDWRHRPVFSLR